MISLTLTNTPQHQTISDKSIGIICGFCLLALLIIACSAPQPDLPQWITNPQSTEGELCEIGSGATDRIATVNAKANLARMIKSQIASEMTLQQTPLGSTFESISTQKAEAMIANSYITHNEKIGDIIYMRLCVKPTLTKDI
ncbi:hypothetical protein FACS1894103_3050 [Campylobacterota bacterium]|nr:hypothetical protein FACS1894103_3050 [Campylobacterota bacterium]